MFLDLSGRITPNPPSLHYGVAALDIDGDGISEFVVAGFGGPNRVLKWVKDRLRDITPPDLADLGREAVGLAAGDLDGDGREEIYILNTDTFAGPKAHADRLFDPLPDGRWSDLFSAPINKHARNLTAGRSVAVIDRRGTGRYGFFIANYGQPMRFYEADPSGRLVDVAPALGLDRITGGRGLWAGPLATDRMDLFCVNEQGPNFLFANNGDGTFAEVADDFSLTDPEEHARGVAVVDINGRLGLTWGNWEGPNRFMVRGPDGTFRNRATPALALPGTVRTVIAADFDNDGWDEVFFNNLDEANRLFAVRSAEFGTRSDEGLSVVMRDCGPAAEPFGRGTGAAVADIDGDGVLELLIAHGEAAPQPLSLYKAETSGNGWLRVKPLTRFGAPARGAAVRVVAEGRTRVKVVDAGSGYLCQMEPVAHFGLGSVTSVESLTVTWPDGSQVTIADPPANALVEVPYPEG